MELLFTPAWEDSPCIYCNCPVGSDGETDDGEFYSCALCRGTIERERERVVGMYTLVMSKRLYRTSAPARIGFLFGPAHRKVHVSNGSDYAMRYCCRKEELGL